MSSLKSMKNITFPTISYEQWKQAAEQSLRGRTVESLRRHTYEQIQLKPLYMKDELKEKNYLETFPSDADFRRGIHPLGYKTSPWKISQQLEATSIVELKQKLAHALKKGQTAIAFRELDELVTNEANFSEVLSEVIADFPFAVRLNRTQQPFLAMLAKLVEERNMDRQQIAGYVAMDPIAKLASQGGLEQTVAQTYDDWAQVIQVTAKELPKVKTIAIDSSVYHNSGANAVQEVAIALAVGVYHIEQLLKRGLQLEEILPRMTFHFSIGANYFMEVAKLRAARVLWAKIVEAYGASQELRKMHLSAETSVFTKTVYDPYVNMLRAANEAFAAVVGGVDYLHVGRFDETVKETSEFAERVARNTQLVLKEEALLDQVIDPAGGSWYVESITNELIEKAWELFLLIEEKGGVFSALQSGYLQTEIHEIKNQRMEDTLTRKQSIVGTNKYANLAEETVQERNITAKQMESTSFVETVEPLQLGRLAVPFEKLRERSEKLQAAVGLICLGDLKDHKPRADFIAGFLSAGGIQAKKSDNLYTAEEINNFVENSDCSHYILCGHDRDYEQFDKQILTELKNKDAGRNYMLAGLPNESEQTSWKDAGIAGFIHVKTNCHDVLSQLLTEMEGEKHDVKA